MLPDRSILIVQKLVENAKIQNFKCNILSNFQTMWSSLNLNFRAKNGVALTSFILGQAKVSLLRIPTRSSRNFFMAVLCIFAWSKDTSVDNTWIVSSSDYLRKKVEKSLMLFMGMTSFTLAPPMVKIRIIRTENSSILGKFLTARRSNCNYSGHRNYLLHIVWKLLKMSHFGIFNQFLSY